MHMPSDPSLARPSDRSSPSASRRRLLKAAARSAPLIATLPSGAALANASAFQCLEKLQDLAGDGLPAGAVPPSTDRYVRVQAKLEVYEDAALNRRWSVYRIPFSGSDVLVDESGNLFIVPDDADLTGTTDVELLVLYRARDNSPNPVTADRNCDLNAVTGWSPTSPENCVFPIAKVNTVQPGNLGMSTSCLCSINPNDPLCTP